MRAASSTKANISREAEKALRNEYDHAISADGQKQLRPRVEPVHEGIAGEVLADGNVFQHLLHLPFRWPRSHASAMRRRWLTS